MRFRAFPALPPSGSIDSRPLGIGGSATGVYRDDATDFRPDHSISAARYFAISPGYLDAARTRLLAGRDVSWNDGPKSPQVAIINQTLSRRIFGARIAAG